MRFAYIDSQGKEVTIPSVDALRLRIELGAIAEDTEFFDSSTGKWAPASDHEIFRTLRRELSENAPGGFVAPLPPVDEAPGPEGPGPASDEGPGDPAAEATETTGEVAGELDVGAIPDPEPPRTGDPETDVFDFGDFGVLELEEDEAEAEPQAPQPQGADPDPSPSDEPPAGGTAGTGDPSAGAEPPEPGVLDLGGPEPGVLDLGGPEPGLLDEPAGGPGFSPADDVAASYAPEEAEAAPEEDEYPVPDWADDDEPEPAPTGGSAGGVGPAGLTPTEDPGFSFETPMDEYDPDRPPDWMQDEEGGVPTAADWIGSDDTGTDLSSLPPLDRGEPPPRPQSRPKGSPPPRKLTPARSPDATRFIVLMTVLAVVVAGGFFGARSMGLIGGGPPVDPILASLPPIPEQMVPQLRRLAARASTQMVAELQTLPEREAIPGEPSDDWLAGPYLADAGAFPEVPAYWNAVGEFVTAVRREDSRLFSDAFREQVDSANLTANDAELLRERGIAGFAATGQDRDLVYSQMDDVVAAALELHTFLSANEGQIDYQPAAGGISEDPVLEAVPATPELGEEMWDRVAEITSALDALGYLDKIETDQLLAVFLEKLEATGIR